MAVRARVQASGSLRLAGAGALASESGHMGATPAGARDATRRLLTEHFSDSTNQSEIRNEIGCYRCHNPPYTCVHTVHILYTVRTTMARPHTSTTADCGAIAVARQGGRLAAAAMRVLATSKWGREWRATVGLTHDGGRVNVDEG